MVFGRNCLLASAPGLGTIATARHALVGSTTLATLKAVLAIKIHCIARQGHDVIITMTVGGLRINKARLHNPRDLDFQVIPYQTEAGQLETRPLLDILGGITEPPVL